MRVCLDTSTLRVRHAGIAVYTLELIQALLGQIGADDGLVSFDGIGGFAPIDGNWPARMRAENEARILGQMSCAVASAGLLEGVMRGGRLRRRLARLAKEARFATGARHYDLCHAVVTLPPGPIEKPLIPLIHDISIQRFPDTHPPERVRAFERWWPAILRCPMVNTVSAFSRNEIVAVLGYPRERIVVTHPGVAPFFFETDAEAEGAALAPLDLGTRRVILLVGSQEPRKNIPVALAAFAALPPTLRAGAVLVVVGGSGWGKLAVPPEAEALIRSGEIRFIGYVSRLHLRALYRRAALLVFPSVYEGFGIPTAEALACGTPVAVSAGTSLEEVAGPHGLHIASGDVQGWREAMRTALEAPEPTPEARAVRRNWVRRFNWQTTAARSLLMYRNLLAGEPMPAELLNPLTCSDAPP
jgi:glycosyltransferase involved in cell wall biosynthesis